MQSGHLGERVLIAAIDGATTRLTPPLLQRYLNTLPQRLTPAAYAARLVRDALARLVAEGIFTDLRSLLIEANADLGRALIERFGALALDRMGSRRRFTTRWPTTRAWCGWRCPLAS